MPRVFPRPAVPARCFVAPDATRRDRELHRGEASQWMMLAVAALAIAGALAIVLVAGRVPVVSLWSLADPDLARRTLAVHVVLAVFVWHVSFTTGLFCLLPRAGASARSALGTRLAALGVLAIILSVGVRSAAPVLSNYIPVLDHSAFLAGLALFTGGVSLTLLDARRFDARRDPTDVGHATRAAATAFLVGVLTFACAYATDRSDASPLVRYERLFWGAGHVLQTSATMAMLATWLALAHRLTGRRTLASRTATVLFALMLAPTLAGPWLAMSDRPHRAFTTMMQLGLAPFVIIVLVAMVRRLRGAASSCSPASVGLATSVAMTLVGFVFAAGISGDTTLVPAHYHLNIGAVTVAFMSFLIAVPQRSRSSRLRRLATWQPLVYGVGQTTFATGLAAAGFWGGTARKVYGPEQQIDAPVERFGLALAAVGGLLALVGGGLFVVLVGRTWRSRHGVRGRRSRAHRRDDRASLRRPEVV